MVLEMQRRYPESKAVAVGFCLGANTVMKYLGETDKNKHNIVAAVSLCQGYDVERYVFLLCRLKSTL